MGLIAATVTHAAGCLPAGTSLNRRYTITSILREDGGGALYLARSAQVRAQAVMVKEVVPDEYMSVEHRAQAERRFAREVRMLRTITHPALPVVLDAFSAGGRHYLAKDAHIGPAEVKTGYPRLAEWTAVRDAVDPTGLWQSDLGRRLGLCQRRPR